MNKINPLKEAQKLVKQLKINNKKIVLAESCTGGMIASLLTRIPGVSEIFCGSLVVYRNETKQKWLNLSPKEIKKHGAVSRNVASKMAAAALQLTPEADISTAITGHLGPTSCPNKEGLLFIGIATRSNEKIVIQKLKILPSEKSADKKLRYKRQVLASHAVLCMVRSLLNSDSTTF